MPDAATPGLKLRQLAETIGEFLSFAPDKIDVDPGFNVRMDTPDYQEYLRELADAIKTVGFRRDRPLTVRRTGDRLTIVDGHSRFAAVRLAMAEGAEIKSIPCVVEDRFTSDADRALSLIASNNGRPLAPLEQSAVIKRLRSYGWETADIARKLGKSVGWVGGLLELAGAPEDVKQMVANNEVSATEAVRVVRSNGPDASATLQAAREHAHAAGKKRITATNTRAVDTRAASGPRPQNKAAWDTVGKARELLELWDHSPTFRQKAPVDFADAMEALRKAVP